MKKQILAIALAFAVLTPSFVMASDFSFKSRDTNRSGRLSFKEFAKPIKKHQGRHYKKGEAYLRFKRMDDNNNGNLSREEFREGRKALRERESWKKDWTEHDFWKRG